MKRKNATEEDIKFMCHTCGKPIYKDKPFDIKTFSIKGKVISRTIHKHCNAKLVRR